MEEVGPFALIGLVILVIVIVVVTVLVIVGLVAFVIFGATGFFVLKDRAELAKRRASEVEPEDAW